jgi:O-acetyl-ADP-ribose deacetylase (regulator of RNase III)
MENRANKKEEVMSRITVVQEDITKLEVDAIVNAANKSLLGGGGVDGAIHRAAGKDLFEFCLTLNGCEVGKAKLSPGFLLPAKYVIHTVGPVWSGGDRNEQQLLSDAYKNSLEIASDKKFKAVAFPNISTGVYGYPKRAAAEIAIKTVKDFLLNHEYPKEVMFVIFDRNNYSLYYEMTH